MVLFSVTVKVHRVYRQGRSNLVVWGIIYEPAVKPFMNWSVYMIMASDNSLYTGITTDIQRRWKQHLGLLAGGAKFFRGRSPVTLAYLENGHDRSSASRRESAIRKLPRARKIKLLLKDELNRAAEQSSELPVYKPLSE